MTARHLRLLSTDWRNAPDSNCTCSPGKVEEVEVTSNWKMLARVADTGHMN